MSTLLSDADMTHLQSTYPYLDIAPLTPQQERFVLAILRGASVRAAEQAAGYYKGGGANLLERKEIKAILDYFRQHTFKEIRVTRETISTMLMESHSKAANVTEEVMAARELGKLHGLYESDNQRATRINNNTLNVKVGQITNAKQLEHLSTEQLLELAALPSLDPQPLPIRQEEIIEVEGQLVTDEGQDD